MRQQPKTRASLFLIELIFAILFFSLGSAVCVQAFVKAHTVSAAAQDLAFASSTVSSAANVARYSTGLEEFQRFFPAAEAEADGYRVCYTGELVPGAAGEDTAYTLHVHRGSEGDAATAEIWMEGRDGATLYALALHWPAEGGTT